MQTLSLLSPNNGTVHETVCEIEDISLQHLTTPIEVYNLKVEDWHTYYVSESGVPVHNIDPSCGVEASNANILKTDKVTDVSEIAKEAEKIKTAQVGDGVGGTVVSSSIKKVFGENKEGTVTRNKLNIDEYTQAQEIVKFRGGHLEGQIINNTPGIDGYLDGVPISLKEYSGTSPSGVLKHVGKAEKQVKNANLENVDLYINAKNVDTDTLISFANNGPLLQVPKQGYINNIYIQTCNG